MVIQANDFTLASYMYHALTFIKLALFVQNKILILILLSLITLELSSSLEARMGQAHLKMLKHKHKHKRSNVIWQQSGLKILPTALNKHSTGAEDAETLRTRFAITASIGYVLINALIMCFKHLMKCA